MVVSLVQIMVRFVPEEQYAPQLVVVAVRIDVYEHTSS
jgi:hypothetical protein